MCQKGPFNNFTLYNVKFIFTKKQIPRQSEKFYLLFGNSSCIARVKFSAPFLRVCPDHLNSIISTIAHKKEQI